MSGSRRVHVAVIAIAVGLGLVGCTAPSAAPSTHASVTAAPTPTPSEPSIPQPRLPLGCRDLADTDLFRAHYRGDTVALVVDENSTARGFSLRAFQQGGGLECVWGGSGRTDGGYDVGAQFFVTADAADEYAAYVAKLKPYGMQVTDKFGDHSAWLCSADAEAEGGYVQCFGDVLVGTTWLDFRMSDGDNPMSTDQAYAWAAEQLTPMVSAISRAGALRPSWTPPSAFDTGKLCNAEVASAIAGLPVTIKMAPADTSGYPVTVGASRAPTTSCTWVSSSPEGNVDISGLTGGGWALAGMSANLAEAPGILGGPAQPVTIPGADGAFVADGEAAWGAVVTHGSLVEVFSDSSQSGKDEVPLMTRIVAYLDAHS